MNDGLISRSALERELLDKGFYPAIVRVAIEKAPAVDAEPVRYGHWEDVGRVYGHEDLFCGVCSECGEITVAFESVPERCSHCGAKMHEEAENETD